MNKDENSEPHTWRTEVAMRPLQHVAGQLQADG
jgi:hypothetical protein